LGDATTSPDDPRFDAWYHTLELGAGVVTRGAFDHRPVLDRYGLPDSLEGKTALDVATADGFFAFELERRGASRVLATDVARFGDIDLLPQIRSRADPESLARSRSENFELAREMLSSKVEHRVISVYDLAPETVGTFDVVFCGSLLLHLHDPLRALLAIRSVTRELAIVETTRDPELEQALPGRPVLTFGLPVPEPEPGAQLGYWGFTTAGLERMLSFAGFAEVEAGEPFELPPTGHPVIVVAARTEPRRRPGLLESLRGRRRRRDTTESLRQMSRGLDPGREQQR
jgi:tRNA (mo5U34)-methyltransferase